MLIEHLEKLRHFQKTTQFRTMSEAAEAIGMSQAGLSKEYSGAQRTCSKLSFLFARFTVLF